MRVMQIPLCNQERKFSDGSGRRFETFPSFAAAILLVTLTNTHSWLTVWGANFYFWGRIIYAILCTADFPLARSLVWNISTIGIRINVAGLFLK